MTSSSSSSSWSPARKKQRMLEWHDIDDVVRFNGEMPIPLRNEEHFLYNVIHSGCETKVGYCEHGTILKIIANPHEMSYPLEHSQNLLTSSTECIVVRPEEPNSSLLVYGVLFYLRQAFYHLYTRNRARNIEAFKNALAGIMFTDEASLGEMSHRHFGRHKTDISVRLILANVIIDDKTVQEIVFMARADFIHTLEIRGFDLKWDNPRYLSMLHGLEERGITVTIQCNDVFRSDIGFCNKVMPSKVILDFKTRLNLQDISFDYELDTLQITCPDELCFSTWPNPRRKSFLVVALQKRVRHLCVTAGSFRGQKVLFRQITDLQIETCDLHQMSVAPMYVDLRMPSLSMPEDLLIKYRKDDRFFADGRLFSAIKKWLYWEKTTDGNFAFEISRALAYRKESDVYVYMNRDEEELESALRHIQHPNIAYENLLSTWIQSFGGIQMKVFTRASYWLRYVRARSDMIKYELVRYCITWHKPLASEEISALICGLAGFVFAPRNDRCNGAVPELYFDHECSDCPSLLESEVEKDIDVDDIVNGHFLKIAPPSVQELESAAVAFHHPNQEDASEEMVRLNRQDANRIDLTGDDTQAEEIQEDGMPDATQASQLEDDDGDLSKGDGLWNPGQRPEWEVKRKQKKGPKRRRDDDAEEKY